MVIAPAILSARVAHTRLSPRQNAFEYGVYYLVLPLPAAQMPGSLASFHAADVGLRDGSDPAPWVRNILAAYNLDAITHHIVLVTMPRVLGHVFNPVSFYLCLDADLALRAVLCEVHNTFGERHNYLCANPDHSPISDKQWLEADKVFHVSPFLDRGGHYRFRFDIRSKKLRICIDYFDLENNRQLLTSLAGTLEPLTWGSLNKAFWRHPLVALKAVTLIHWQALKLLLKGVRYRSKPAPLATLTTPTRNLDSTREKSWSDNMPL